MADMIERYVYDVTRRLPEKDRAEVGRELGASIYDMLADDADEAEIRRVLTGLGSPAKLAEKYRIKPRYLISPSIYDDYIRVLKWLLPLVGGLMLALGALLGIFDVIKNGEMPLSDIIASAFSKALALGVSGTLQALVWATIGFAIADRSGAKKTVKGEEWTLDQLPEEIIKDKNKIPLSDSIAELVIVAIVSAIGILFCFDRIPLVFAIQNGEICVSGLFSAPFITAFGQIIVVGCLLTVVECITKIVYRRFTWPVCAAVVANNVIGIGLMAYLLTRTPIFSAEFIALIEAQAWTSVQSTCDGVLFMVVTVVVISALAECGFTIYRTIQAERRNG